MNKLYTEATRYKKEFNKDINSLYNQQSEISKKKGLIDKINAYKKYKEQDKKLGEKYGTYTVDKYGYKTPSISSTKNPLYHGKRASYLISKYNKNKSGNNFKNTIDRYAINYNINSGKEGKKELDEAIERKITERNKIKAPETGSVIDDKLRSKITKIYNQKKKLEEVHG